MNNKILTLIKLKKYGVIISSCAISSYEEFENSLFNENNELSTFSFSIISYLESIIRLEDPLNENTAIVKIFLDSFYKFSNKKCSKEEFLNFIREWIIVIKNTSDYFKLKCVLIND